MTCECCEKKDAKIDDLEAALKAAAEEFRAIRVMVNAGDVPWPLNMDLKARCVAAMRACWTAAGEQWGQG